VLQASVIVAGDTEQNTDNSYVVMQEEKSIFEDDHLLLWLQNP
jgi:hypothetical protein